jgi:hypothetical protein
MSPGPSASVAAAPASTGHHAQAAASEINTVARRVVMAIESSDAAQASRLRGMSHPDYSWSPCPRMRRTAMTAATAIPQSHTIQSGGSGTRNGQLARALRDGSASRCTSS